VVTKDDKAAEGQIMELISVIVPVYKVEKYLERCVRSIQKQTYENLEIILVDDGSPDQCGALCDQYAQEDGRIKVLHKQNGGLSDARNAGIELASGSYIVFADSDDWLDRDMIDLLYRVLKRSNADIAECSYRNIYRDHIMEETSCSAALTEGDSVTALEGMLDWKYFKPVAWNKLYKREVFGTIRYPKGRLHEDEFTTYKYFYNAEKVSVCGYIQVQSTTGQGKTVLQEKNIGKTIWMRAGHFGSAWIFFMSIILCSFSGR